MARLTIRKLVNGRSFVEVDGQPLAGVALVQFNGRAKTSDVVITLHGSAVTIEDESAEGGHGNR